MPWVARYPWGGIQSASGEIVPPQWLYNQEFARTSGWQWEDPIGTPNASTAPGPPPQPPAGFVWTPDAAPPPVTPPGPEDARAKASKLLYEAMQGMPSVSAPFLTALQGGQLPAPNAFTPQTIKTLGEDPFLSDTFFSLIEAAGVYPTSYLAEVNRFLPKGAGTAVAPSFI